MFLEYLSRKFSVVFTAEGISVFVFAFLVLIKRLSLSWWKRLFCAERSLEYRFLLFILEKRLELARWELSESFHGYSLLLHVCYLIE